MLSKALLQGSLPLILVLMVAYPLQRVFLGLHPIFGMINSQHLFVYNVLFFLMTILKMIRGILNFNVFWNYVFNDRHLMIIGHCYEFASLIMAAWGDARLTILAILYKVLLINLNNWFARNMAIPILFAWTLIRNSYRENTFLPNPSDYLDPGFFPFVASLIVLKLLLRFYMEPRIRVSVSDTVSPDVILDVPWNYREIQDKAGDLNFDSTFVPFHVILLLGSVESNIGANLRSDNAPVWILLLLLTFMQVYLECLQVNKFDLILKHQHSMIRNRRPGKESRGYLNGIFLRIILINYVQVVLLYKGWIRYPSLISAYNLLVQLNLLRRLWVFAYLGRHFGSKGRKMGSRDLRYFWRILGSVYGL